MRAVPRAVAALSLAAASVALATDEPRLPLPDAPVLLVIPDAAAFDAALSGAFRRAATGGLDPNDPLVAAWRQSPVGSKLEAEWAGLSAKDLPWTWTEIRRLQPRSVGVALLSAGALEAVMAIDTPLATLPVAPPAGSPKSHRGAAYAVVASGAGDAAGRGERRMGLAWARRGSVLLLATSERALLLALDEAATGRGAGPFLPGLASLELDLDRLREDRYFVREFAPGLPSDRGRVRAALRLEAGGIVEVRAGRAPAVGEASVFAHADAAVAGWEPDGARFFRALRAGLLEPEPTLVERPVPALTPLPATTAETADRYLVRLDQPPRTEAGAGWEAGDIAAWEALVAQRPAPGWGFWADAAGARAIVFAWPEARQKELEKACRDTLARRAGAVTTALLRGDVVEMRVGPGLPALALRRTGAFVWIGTSAPAVAGREAPRAAGDVARWARVDLAAARAAAEAWARAEGPASPERVRPFSDRVLGLLGWMPSVRAIAVERRQAGEQWTERVAFEGR